MKNDRPQVDSEFYGVWHTNSKVEDRFPVQVVWRNGGSRDTVTQAWMQQFDGDTLKLHSDTTIPKGKRVRLKFKLPESIAPAYTGVDCDFPGLTTGAREGGKAAAFEIDLKWGEPLRVLVRGTLTNRWRKFAGLIGAMLLAMAWYRWTTFQFFWYDPLFYVYNIAIGAFYFTRFYLSQKHKPPVWSDNEPGQSIIISVRNEEDAIASTVYSCLAVDYPKDKFEIIVVNDGSTDRTPQILEQLQKELPELRVFHIPPSGKRHGMAKGFYESKFEFCTMVDSDTLLHPMALRHIVCGFEDPTVGAVAGFTDVGNGDKNVLTRMQRVRYRMSYELMKAPEGLFGAVTCCPGSLSTYRKSYVMPILKPWLNQRFLGAPATFGDDRSLTNYILKDYQVLYNPNAHSSTLVPETWMRYMKQQVRWKKSWVREFLIAGRFMYRKNPIAALSFYIAGLCSLISPFMVGRAIYYAYQTGGASLPGYVTGLFLLGLTMGVFVSWTRPTKYWYMSWMLIGVQVVLMGPQTYYAMLTMRKNHWGTR